MGYIKRSALPAVLLTLLLPTSPFAQKVLVDDHSDGTNANEFDGYWYYYDDNIGVKADDRPQAGPSTKPSVINVPYIEKHREAFGDKTDTWPVKDYTFMPGEEENNRFATMPFTFGEIWEASYGDACPYVGMSTQLAPEGKYISLAGATGITFKIRSHKAAFLVNFKVETFDIAMDSSETYYQKTIPVTTTWTEVTVPLSDLFQPSWTPAASEFIFDSSKVTNLTWEVPSSINRNVVTDTLDLDDIYVNGCRPISQDTIVLKPSGGLFSSFEGEQKHLTPLHTSWYAFNDHEIGGSSAIISGSHDVEGTDLKTIDFFAGTGSDFLGYGAAIQMKIGPAINRDGVNVYGFTGIGCNLYDSATATYFNATTGKRGTEGGTGSADGIYFEYLYDGGPKYMTLEICDKYDVGDKDNPSRKESRGPGIVWYRNYQKNGSGWKAVYTRFSDLLIHSDWQGYINIPLDPSNLAKVQFKVQGSEGMEGLLQVDNIYFPGINFDGSKVNSGSRRSNSNRAFTATCAGGSILVRWEQTGLTGGKVSLVTLKGDAVRSAVVAGGHSLTISAAGLAAGMYFINFCGSTTNGKPVTQHTVFTIIR